ncbi:alpha/beta fold hydrolase [Mycobacterium deserti]|uniref:AB hydrolase-1 domain-containing protein n=1 Tax=Mycobacterium deserti TaxID=2978347 RepID=A0ABT2M5J1_9MYCO|nr:alpha/beta fold hydrolase [Mycobacterium deserti]MCT7657533.1 hypothetical protein [Mycobacterium deserti]
MKPTLVFVHSPVVGPSTWAATANMMRHKGFRCEVPDLTEVVSMGPPFYQKLAAAAARPVSGGGSVVLIGHSAAGSLLPAIADAVPGPVRAIFVDAQLPHPGQSWFETAPAPLCAQLREMAEGDAVPRYHEWFSPRAFERALPDAATRRRFVAELPRVPLAYFEEPAPVTRRLGRKWAYVRLSPAFDHAADEAARRGWWVARREWDHLRMLTAPDAVADVVARAVAATRLDGGT